MRIIDFLQFISDLDKQTQFFYQDQSDQILSISDLTVDEKDNQVVLHTKKAKQHGLRQWELVTLLNKIKPKTNFILVESENKNLNIFGLQLHNRKVYLK